MTKAKTAVILVHYETPDSLAEVVKAALREPAVAAVTVVDHSPSEDVRPRVAAPEVRYFHNPENPGFGAGVNFGIRRTPGMEFYLIGNCDIRWTAGVPGRLLAMAEGIPRGGVFGPRIVDSRGRIEPSWGRFPGIFTEIQERFRHRHAGHPWFQRRWRKQADPRRVPWVTGACMLIRRAAWEAVGGFDERFFLYYEDCDFCYRARTAGWETWYLPGVTVVHRRGESVRRADPVWITRRRRESQRYYYAKHRPRWEQALLTRRHRRLRAVGDLSGDETAQSGGSAAGRES